MASIIYSKLEGKNDPMFGKFEHPIKALIESESNYMEKQKDVLSFLFNVEKSNRYAETVISEGDFKPFQATKEGQGAENDSIDPGYTKTIEHIAFMKEFTITREMADDSKIGIASNISSKPKKFVRSYYLTRKQIAEQALINGTATSMTYNKAKVDLTVGDGKALFHKAHTFKNKSGTQANYFVNGSATSMLSASTIEDTLMLLANKMRNFKDEGNNNLGYVPDVLIVPANRPGLEALCKKVIGSERTIGSGNNDINIQYGQWSLVVLDGWEESSDKIMVMSREANEQLMANMFYNRVALDVTNWIDKHTRNYIWNGYCRFGVGFTNWKHIILFDDAASNASAEAINS